MWLDDEYVICRVLLLLFLKFLANDLVTGPLLTTSVLCHSNNMKLIKKKVRQAVGYFISWCTIAIYI